MSWLFKSRRCYWYEADGTPVVHRNTGMPGCRNGAGCMYAHPGDPQWATATDPKPPKGGYSPPPPPARGAPSLRRSPSPYGPPPPPPGMPPPPLPGAGSLSTTKELPPRIGRVVSASSSHGSDRDRDRDRDSATRSLSRTRYSTGHPRDTSPGASSIASSSDPRIRKTSSFSSLPPPERRREEERMRYREDERRRDDDRKYDDRRRDREDDRRREDERRRREDWSRERRSRSRSHSHRPKEVSEEERRRIWMERVKFLTESVLARGEIVRLREDVLKYERITKSSGFERLEAADKAAMEELIATTKQRAQAKQLELDATLSKLIPSDYYPFATAPSSRASDAAFDRMHFALNDLRADVEALLQHVEKLRVATATLQTPATPLAPAATPAPSTKAEDGEVTADTARPKKRRRLSIEQSSEPSTQVSDPTAEDFDDIKERLMSLDGRIAGLENDFRQYDSKVTDEVDAQLDYRGISRSLGGATNAELTETYQKLEQQVAEAGGNVADIISGIKQLTVDGEEQDARYSDLLKENKDLQAQLTKLQQNQTEMKQKLEERRSTLDALTAAVKTFISQPSQPLPQQPPTATEIITTVQPRVLRAVRDDIKPLLNDLKTQIDKVLKEQADEVNGTLITQITPTIRAVEAISAWVDRYRLPPTVPNPPSAPGPSASAAARAP